MNEFLLYMVKKLGRGGSPTPTNVAWNISPKVNAVFRNGTKDDKKILFEGFVGKTRPEDALKIATRCHKKQTEEAKAIFEQCDGNCLIRDNCVVAFIDNQHKEYTGLIAAKFMSKYNKVAFVLRKPDSTSYSGSFRSPVGILDLINSSGYANSRGHGQAAGFICKVANLERFLDWFDKQDLSEFTGEIAVTAKLTPKIITTKLCHVCEKHEDIWGHGIPEPTFYIKADINESNVQVFEKKTTTIKISVQGVDFLLFMAKPDDVKALTKNGSKRLEMIVTLSTNTWNGVTKPQGKIKQFEVGKVEDRGESEESWMDDF